MSDWFFECGDDGASLNPWEAETNSNLQDETTTPSPTSEDENDPFDPLGPSATSPNSWTGDDSGGYPGGPTPDGYTPHEDGTGRFMYDSQGRMHITPAYAEWLNDPDQEIDWGNVVIGIAGAAGISVGLLPFYPGIVLGGWVVSVISEFLLDYRAIDTSP